MKKYLLLLATAFICTSNSLVSVELTPRQREHLVNLIEYAGNNAARFGLEFLASSETLTNEEFLSGLRLVTFYGVASLAGFPIVAYKEGFAEAVAHAQYKLTNKLIFTALYLSIFYALKKIDQTEKGHALLSKIGLAEFFEDNNLKTLNIMQFLNESTFLARGFLPNYTIQGNRLK